jgi:hypothetical protein
LPRPVSGRTAYDSTVGLASGTGANVLFRAESRPARLQAQQAEKPAVGTDDRGPSSPGGDHRPVHFGQAGAGWHRTACEPSQRRHGSIRSRATSDVLTFHDSLQVPGRADDQRGMDMIVAEEVPNLINGGGRRMPCGSREHHIGSGACDLIHRSRIRIAGRTALARPGVGGHKAQSGPGELAVMAMTRMPTVRRILISGMRAPV